jgi:hypothetical protein
MVTNGNTVELTNKQREVAQLVAEDKLGDRQIAIDSKIGVQTLERWKKICEFRELVRELRQQCLERILREGIADPIERTKRRQKHWEGLQKGIEKRARGTGELGGVEGDETGLFIFDGRKIVADDTTLKQIAELETLVQLDLKQLTTLIDLTSGGKPIRQPLDLSGMTLEELETLDRLTRKLHARGNTEGDTGGEG